MRWGDYPTYLVRPNLITRKKLKGNRKSESEIYGDLNSCCGIEEGGRGLEPRSAGSLWKLEKIRNGNPPEPPERKTGH